MVHDGVSSILSSGPGSSSPSGRALGVRSRGPTSRPTSPVPPNLSRPRVPPAFVPRPRLIQLLDAGNERPVTLVSAGAGWGKTLLVASWAETADVPLADIAGLGRRNRLDRGVLGLLAVTLRGARDAVRLVRGRRSGLVKVSTATEAVIETDADRIPVGVDGEEVTLATPVHCAIRPGVLRVRVPRLRPGVRPGFRGTRVHTAMVGT